MVVKNSIVLFLKNYLIKSLTRPFSLDTNESRKKIRNRAVTLEKQDLFINSTLVHIGCDLLWRIFKEGKTLYHGAYVNWETLKMSTIPI